MPFAYSNVLEFLYRVLKEKGEAFKEEIRQATLFALADIGQQANWEFSQDTTTITTQANKANYSIPNVQSVRNITCIYGTDGVLDYYPVREFREKYAGSTTTGAPTAYTFWKNEVVFHPIPEGVLTFTCDVIRKIGSEFQRLLDEDGAPLLIAATLHYLDPNDVVKYKKYERLLQVTLKNISKVKDKTQFIQQDERMTAWNNYIKNLY